MAPPSSSSSRQPYEYLDALLTALPNDAIPPEIARGGAYRPYPKFVDTALRLASGGPARPDDATDVRDAWPEIQASVQRALHALHPSSSSSSQPTKRKHSPPSSSFPGTNNKKPKYEDELVDDDDDDDAPQLTLHALSATAPVRHKIDITLHVRTLRFAHSTTGAHIARCALTALTRVFLLPTRARSSGALQWSALILAGDKPTPPPRRGAKAKGTATPASAVRFELACSVPDSSSPTAIPRLTIHTSTPTSASASHVTNTREALLALLSPTISDIPITLTTVERGALLAGITAFLGVRETTLWFFDEGILANARPAEFWALADLAPGEAGVRVRTATGRTCSVVLMRRGSGGTGEHDGEEEEEEEGEETEFQMIDGKEREVIGEWVRKHRGAFGIATEVRGEDDDDDEALAQAASHGAEAAAAEEKGDSDSDSDFEAESGDSDGGSPSSGSGSSSGSARGPGSDAGSDAGSSEQEGEDEDEPLSGPGSDGDDDDMMELDPKHHPLLRAGGLPKMSKAAMDAAVELVVGDFVGKASRDASTPGSGSGPGLGRPNEVEGDDDEEDELED